MTRQGPKTFAARLGRAEKAKRAAELYVEKGWTWDRIAKEVGYSHRATAMKAAKEWRDEIPMEAQEELRRTLLDRTEARYAAAVESRAKIKDPVKAVEADAKIARIVKTMGELGRVIQVNPPAVVNVTQNTSDDLSAWPIEDVRALHELRMKNARKAEADVSQNVTTIVVEKRDTKP